MKPFKKRGFWVLFVFVVLVGAFFIVNSGLKNQSAIIPNVEAQGYGSNLGYGYGSNGSMGYGGAMPTDIMFSRSSSPSPKAAGLLPGDVVFTNQLSHPGSVMFTFPGDVMTKSSNGKTKMRTIMTCSGCATTMATCDWDCGRTFSYCNTGNIYGGSFTGLTCPGPTGMICGSGGNTLIACSTGMICGSGGNTNIVCPTGMICGSGGNTLIACSTGMICGSGGNTLMSCSTNLSGCGQTALFCPRQPALYGGEYGYGGYGIGGIGSRTMSGVGCSGIQMYGGIGSLGIAPTSTPAF